MRRVYRPTATPVLIIVIAALLAPVVAHTADDGARLRGVVIAADSKDPINQVRVILDSVTVWISLPDGSFEFGPMAPGPHVLVFEHIAYTRRALRFDWPGVDPSLVVELQPTQFVVPAIEVTAERTIPSLPVSAVAFDREMTVMTPGNIANDPLRTVQSHPSAATAGIDFLSTMAVRGGNTEEHRVYFDNFPLRHYSHVGGFSSVVYDDILESTVLVPGAAPIRYKGALSGIIMFESENPDTSSISARYDITSLAAAFTHVASPSTKLQASAKADFFNLPVYQQIGVEDRSFKDLLLRARLEPGPSWTIRPSLLLARDEEIGEPVGGVALERETASALAGVDLRYHHSDWEVTLRPHYSFYQSRDGLTWTQSASEHRLNEARMFGEASRQGPTLGFAVSGEVGFIRHDGHGGELSDTPFSASAETRLMYKDAAAVIVGVGGSREEWTSTVEPEYYGSARVGVGEWLALSCAVRRSHQSPFLFSERRYFASIPIDPGDLVLGYVSSHEDARAVRMDQASVEARLNLPFKLSLEGNGFWREYDDLLRWDWEDFPTPGNVVNGGVGRGHGYELVFARNDPDLLSVMAAVSSARVWKTEGTLETERIGDFDKPDAYQVGGSVRITSAVRLSIRWTDVAGRPFTLYDYQTTPPPDSQVNDERLDRFRRLDVKLTYDIPGDGYHAMFFVDIVNFLGRRNIAATYALEVSPGEFVTVPYGGTLFFPMGGITIHW